MPKTHTTKTGKPPKPSTTMSQPKTRTKTDYHQRSLISNMYICVFDAPPPSEWGEKGKHGGLVAAVAMSLGILPRSYGTVRRVMNKTYEALSGGFDLDLSRASRTNKSQYKIKEGSKYEIMVCKHLEEGSAIKLTSSIVSMQMMADGLKQSISKTAVISVINRLNPITNTIKVKGQWSENHEAWIIARYNWSLHLLVRLGYHKNKIVIIHLRTFNPLPDWLNRTKLEEGGFCFHICQVGFFDETHLKILLGHLGFIQYRFKWEGKKPVANQNDTYEDLRQNKINEYELQPMTQQERQQMRD